LENTEESISDKKIQALDYTMLNGTHSAFTTKLCCWIQYIPFKNSAFLEFVYSNRKAFHKTV